MADVINRDKYNYDRVRFKDSEGKVRHSASNGDAVAKAMLGLTADQIQEAIRVNGLADKLGSYKNAGLLRMAVGNALRALVRKGQSVTVGAHVIKKLDQRVVIDEATKEPPKPKVPRRKKDDAEAA